MATIVPQNPAQMYQIAKMTGRKNPFQSVRLILGDPGMPAPPIGSRGGGTPGQSKTVGLSRRGMNPVGGNTNVGVAAGGKTGLRSVVPWRSYSGMQKQGGRIGAGSGAPGMPAAGRIGYRGEAPLAPTTADYTAEHGGLSRQLPSNLDRFHAGQSYSRDPGTGQRMVPAPWEMQQERSKLAKAGDWEQRGAFEQAMQGDRTELDRVREWRRRMDEDAIGQVRSEMDPGAVADYRARMAGHRSARQPAPYQSGGFA